MQFPVLYTCYFVNKKTYPLSYAYNQNKTIIIFIQGKPLKCRNTVISGAL